uniref:YMRFamide neuropeptide n=1 Tax=Lumbriculus variegatus TaxID=61662 RepID=Q6DTZ6_9ANNE|nr:YMRFamide neuropeptide precursor [Lumbriculus variegatus]
MCTVSVTSGLVFLAVSIAVLFPVNGAREEDIEEALDGHSKSSSQAAAAAAANRALLLTGMQYYNGRLGDDDMNQLEPSEDMAEAKRYMRFGRGSQQWRLAPLYDPYYAMSKRYMRFGRGHDDGDYMPVDENEAAEKRYMRFGKRYMRFGRMVNNRGENV